MSKNLFLRLLREDFKRRAGNTFFCIYLTIFGMIALHFIPDWEFSLRSMLVGPGNGPLFIMNILWALVLGFGGFSCLFSRKKSDFYFTLPVSRKKLFLASWLNGILIFFLLNVLCRMVFYWIAVRSGRADGKGEEAVCVSLLLLGIVLSLLTFLFFYHLVIISCVLAGSGPAGLFLFSFLLCYGEVWISGILVKYNRMFFHSFYRSSFLEELRVFLSPVRLCGSLLGAVSWKFVYENNILGNWLIENHWKYLNVVLLAAILTFLPAFFLFRARAAENAEKALAFKKVQPVLRFLAVIPVGLFCGYGVCSLAGAESVLRVAAGMALGAVLTHGLLEAWFHSDAMAAFRKPLQLAGAWGCGLLVAAVYFLCGDRYDFWMPPRDRIESMAVSVAGLDTGITGNGKQDREALTEERLRLMELTGEAKENACDWIEKLMAQTAVGREDRKEEPEAFTVVTVAYRLTDDTTDYRRYEVTDRQLLEDEDFDAVYRSVDYRKGEKQVPPDLDMYGRNVIWSNGAETWMLDLDEKEIGEILKAYLDDTGDFSVRLLKTEQPSGSLTWATGETFTGSRGYLYPGMERTRAFLQRRGIPVERTMEDYAVRSAELLYYDEEGSVKSTSKLPTEELKKLKLRLLPCELYRNEMLCPVDRSVKVKVKYKNSEAQTADIVECYLLEPLKE